MPQKKKTTKKKAKKKKKTFDSQMKKVHKIMKY